MRHFAILVILPFLSQHSNAVPFKDIGPQCFVISTANASEIYRASHQSTNARAGCQIDEFRGLDLGVIPEVVAGEYMISDSKHHSHLLSNGFGPCYGVTFYDPKTKTGMLAHVPPNTPYRNDGTDTWYSDSGHIKWDLFKNQLKLFSGRGIPVARLQVRIYSGAVPVGSSDISALRQIFAKEGLFDLKVDPPEAGIKAPPFFGLGEFKVLSLDTGTTDNYNRSGTSEYLYIDSRMIDRSGYFDRSDSSDAILTKGYLAPVRSVDDIR